MTMSPVYYVVIYFYQPFQLHIGKYFFSCSVIMFYAVYTDILVDNLSLTSNVNYVEHADCFFT